jgi:hypothetical protein
MAKKRCGDNPDSDEAGPVQQWREASYQPCISEYRAPVSALGPMQTIVFQSYRTQQVPAWISTCMGTVRAWAAQQGFDYRFYDDAFLGYAPPWFRDKAQQSICPVTDLARLVVARELLAQGYQRTVWVDADMLVFAPEQLRVEQVQDFSFCHELWVQVDAAGALQLVHRVNNAITVFCAGNVQLGFFIDACLRIGRHKAQIGKLDVGTKFLTELRAVMPYPLLENVGMLSPRMLYEITGGEALHLRRYAQGLPVPLACANLCASMQGRTLQGVVCDDALYARVIEVLLSSRGGAVNGLRPAGPGARV